MQKKSAVRQCVLSHLKTTSEIRPKTKDQQPLYGLETGQWSVETRVQRPVLNVPSSFAFFSWSCALRLRPFIYLYTSVCTSIYLAWELSTSTAGHSWPLCSTYMYIYLYRCGPLSGGPSSIVFLCHVRQELRLEEELRTRESRIGDQKGPTKLFSGANSFVCARVQVRYTYNI